MADDQLRIAITGDASGASSAIGKVSEQATGLGADLKQIGAAGVEAGAQVSEGMEKANYSMTEARHAAHLLGEEIGVKVPRALQSIIASSETVGPALAAAFSAIAIPAFVELGTKVVEKLTDMVSEVFIYTESMKNADAATRELNNAIETQEKRLDAAEKAFARVGLSASALANLKIGDDLRENLSSIQESLGKANEKIEEQGAWWKTALNAASDYFLGTTKMIDEAVSQEQELKNNQIQAAKAEEEARKDAATRAATVEKEEMVKFTEAQKKAFAEFDKINFAAYEKRLKDAADEETKEEELQDKLVSNWLADTEKMGKSAPKFDMNAFLGGGVSQFTKDIEAGAAAASQFGIVLKTDLIKELQDAKDAYAALQKLGPLVDPKDLDDLKKRIQDLDTAIKQFGQDASDAKQRQEAALNSLDGRLDAIFNTQTLVKKGWAAMGAQAVQSLDEIGVQLIKHLAIALMTDNLEKISAAKTAAAKSWEAMAGIPVVGPELGAVAAASTFAGAMAFKQGGIVPSAAGGMITDPYGDVAGIPAVLHPNEMVLPAPISQTVQDMAASASGGNGGHTFHITAMDGADVERVLTRHTDVLGKAMHRSVDKGHFNVRNAARGK